MQNRNKKILGCLLFLVLLVFIFPLFTHAADSQPVNDQFGLSYAAATGLSTQDIRVTVAKIIRIALGLLGLVVLVIILYGGFVWMTAAGAPDKIEKAKKILINGVIGLVIILSAFAIVTFIINGLTQSLFGTSAGNPANWENRGRGALGAGIIEDHYPQRNQTNVPRNTRIIVTFKEPMDPNSIIEDTNNNGVLGDCDLYSHCDQIRKNSIKIYKKTEGGVAPDDNLLISASAFTTADHKIYVFASTNYLGSPDQDEWQAVYLTKDIKKENSSQSALGNDGYVWFFETSTVLDLTPPQIVSVFPFPATTKDALGNAVNWPRNAVVQINFNEAIDPTAVVGAAEIQGGGTVGEALTASSFSNIVVQFKDNDKDYYVAGNFYIGNNYRTVEFITKDFCGYNSCGDQIFCLPGMKDFTATIKAATVSLTNPPQASSFPYDGVVDVCANSLDGNRDGKGDGPAQFCTWDNCNSGTPGDSVKWLFSTSNTVDLTPPKITEVKPTKNESFVSLTDPIKILFSKILMKNYNTLSSDNVGYKSNYSEQGNEVLSWFLSAEDVDSTTPPDNIFDGTQVSINHSDFNKSNLTDPDFSKPYIYTPFAGSKIKDIFQNCYLPCQDADSCIATQNGAGTWIKGDPWNTNPDSEFPTCDQSVDNVSSGEAGECK